MIDRIGRQIAFFAPAAVMSAWGTVMLHAFVSGHINHLLSPIFRSYVLVAAIVLLLLSVLHLFLYQPNQVEVPLISPRSRLRQMGRWLVLLLPVLAASVLSPSALSSTTMENRSASPLPASYAMPSMSVASRQNVQDAIAADLNQPVPMEVTDLVTVSHSPDQMKAFDGRKVRVVGLAAGTDSPKLARWIMWCCAADAVPVSVSMEEVPAHAPWAAEQWLEVVGTVHFPSTLGQVVPQIQVESIKPTQEPDEPFLSP